MTERMISADDLVGTVEIAERLGVSINTVYSWIQRGSITAPIVRVSGTPLWEWPTVRDWAIETGRLAADPA